MKLRDLQQDDLTCISAADAGVQENLIAAVVGHAHSTQTARYGRGFDPKVLASAVASITYPGVEIS
jgi:hypothetical protein